MTGADNVRALTPVVEALEQLGVAYQIGGSVASSARGVARSTLDVDIVADLQPGHVAPLVAALDDAFYVAESAVMDAVARTSCFNLVHLETMVKVDVFVLKQRPFDQQAFARRRSDTLDDGLDARSFFITSAEDIILHKLEGFRLGGETSERQWGDVIGIIKVQAAALDQAYLDTWTQTLGLGELLRRALREAAE